MNVENQSPLVVPPQQSNSLTTGWMNPDHQIIRLEKVISSISSLLTQPQQVLQSNNNMKNPPLTVSQVLETITPGNKENPSWINGGITGLAEVKELTSKAGKKFWKVILTDEDTGQSIESMTYSYPKIQNNQRIAITGTGIQRKEDNEFKGTTTPQFSYGDKAFIQVLDFASTASHPDLEPVPKKSSVAQRSLLEPIGGFHDQMKSNSLFMAHCAIYANQTIEAIALVKPKVAEMYNNTDGFKFLTGSFFIEGSRQGLNKDVPSLTIPNVTVKKVTPAMEANLLNTDGSDAGDEDAPF